MQFSQPTFSLFALIHHLVKKSNDDLKNCIREMNEITLNEYAENIDLLKKQILFQHFQETRERFIRLLILTRWAKKSKKILDKYNEVTSAMERKSNAFAMAADTLLFVSRNIQSLREPVFDLPTAIDVLTTGTYPRLPYLLQQTRNMIGDDSEDKFTEKDKERALNRLTDLIRMKLLQCTIPNNMFVNKLENGQVNLIGENEFSIILTLQQKPNNNLNTNSFTNDVKYFWKIIFLQLLVNEEGVTVSPIYDELVFKLANVLQKRLLYLDETDVNAPPLVDMYQIIHSVTTRLTMDILSRQARKLQFQKWGSDVITCDTFNEQVDQELSLTITYWHKAPPILSFVEKYSKYNQLKENEEEEEEDRKTSYLRDRTSKNEIKIFVDKSKQIIFDFQPSLGPFKTPSLNYSKINLSKIIIEIIFHHCIERLQSIKNYLLIERIFENVEIVTRKETNQVELFLNVFETYRLCLSICWKTGSFELRGMSENEDLLSLDFTDLVSKLNSIEIRKVTFQDLLLDILEKARRRLIIFAYKKAGSLLGLESFETLFDGDMNLMDEFIYFRFPEFNSVFIEIRANPLSLKRGKPLVNSRIILERSPRVIEIQVSSDLFFDCFYPDTISSPSIHQQDEGEIEPNIKKQKRVNNSWKTIFSNFGRSQMENEEDSGSNPISNIFIGYKHLSRIIQKNRFKVSHALVLRKLQLSSNFSFDVSTNENEIIIYPNEGKVFKYLELNYLILKIDPETCQWEVSFYENNPLPIILPENTKSVQKYYNLKTNRLSLSYTTIESNEFLDKLYADIESIDRMTFLVKQLIEPTEYFQNFLSKYCTIDMLTHLKIKIDYGNVGYKVVIQWNKKLQKYDLKLFPTHRLEYEYDTLFNKYVKDENVGHEAIFRILQLLLKTSILFIKLQTILSNQSTLWTIIPRTISNHKLIYKYQSIILLKFIIECKPNGLIEIRELSNVSSLPATNTINNEQDNSQADSFFLQINQLSELDKSIHKLNRYATSLVFFNSSIPLLKVGTLLGLDLNIVSKHKYIVTSTAGEQYEFTIIDNEFKCTNIQSTKKSNEAVALKDVELNFLRSVFSNRVIHVLADFGFTTTNAIRSYFQILRCPAIILKQLIHCWHHYKDIMDIILFQPYPNRKLLEDQQKTTEDLLFFTNARSSNNTGELRFPKVFQHLDIGSNDLFIKQQQSVIFILRLYYGLEYIDLPMEWIFTGTLRFIFASRTAGQSIIEHVMKEEKGEDLLMKLMHVLTEKHTIQSLTDME
ncbi:hypothetical protein ABK040_015561 [Willaertia magna]